MTYPNFFLVGAPKCGTTTLATWLSKTPACYFSPRKEPHFYTRHYKAHRYQGYDQHDRNGYQRLFDDVQPHHKAIGEGSTHYLRSPDAILTILQEHPAARFIACVRNPVDMARSMHSHSVFWGNEHILDFEEAWRAQNDRRNGNRVRPWMKNSSSLVYGDLCSLGTQVKSLLGKASRDQVNIILMDDIKNDPESTYHRTCSFLDITPADISLAAENISRTKKSHLLQRIDLTCQHYSIGPSRIRNKLRRINRRWNVSNAAPPGISKNFRKELVEYFATEINILEEICQRDLSHWRS